jgi:hypothetical protein
MLLLFSTGAYSIYVQVDLTGDTSPVKCKDITQFDEIKSSQQLIMCEYPNGSNRKGNRISIKRTESGPIKLFEIKPIGMENMQDIFHDQLASYFPY